MSETPLQTTNSNSLSAIFNKNPEEITDQELEVIVDALRKDRERFLLTEKSAGKKVAASPDLSLKDLDL